MKYEFPEKSGRLIALGYFIKTLEALDLWKDFVPHVLSPVMGQLTKAYFLNLFLKRGVKCKLVGTFEKTPGIREIVTIDFNTIENLKGCLRYDRPDLSIRVILEKGNSQLFCSTEEPPVPLPKRTK